MTRSEIKIRNQIEKIINEHFITLESDKTLSRSDVLGGCDLGVFAVLESKKAANKILELFDVKNK